MSWRIRLILSLCFRKTPSFGSIKPTTLPEATPAQLFVDFVASGFSVGNRRVDRIEFLEGDPISVNLVFTFSLGGRRVYQLPEDEQGSCFQARETTQKEVSSKKRSQAAFRAAVVRRYGDKRCALCDAPSEVIEAAHMVPVSENGSDDCGNGLLLCRKHQALFDKGK